MKIVLKELDGKYVNANEGKIMEIEYEPFLELVSEKIGEEYSIATLKNGINILYNYTDLEDIDVNDEKQFERFNMQLSDDVFIYGNCIFVNLSKDNEVLSLTDEQIDFLSNVEVLRREYHVDCIFYKEKQEAEIITVKALRDSDALFMVNDIIDEKYPNLRMIEAGMGLGSSIRSITYIDRDTNEEFVCALEII